MKQTKASNLGVGRSSNTKKVCGERDFDRQVRELQERQLGRCVRSSKEISKRSMVFAAPILPDRIAEAVEKHENLCSSLFGALDASLESTMETHAVTMGSNPKQSTRKRSTNMYEVLAECEDEPKPKFLLAPSILSANYAPPKAQGNTKEFIDDDDL